VDGTFKQKNICMKIAVTGAHRTGKTTLVEKLNEALPEYSCKAEAYYELEEKGCFFSEIPTLEDYILQLEYSIDQLTTGGDNVIFDRCPIDMLAYIKASQEFENFDIQSMYQRVQNVITEIDLLVFVAIENPDVIRCQESDLPELRQQVNEILNDWIFDFDVDVLEVSGSLLERRNKVIEYILKH
jgi:nicotinamide riboside kinase